MEEQEKKQFPEWAIAPVNMGFDRLVDLARTLRLVLRGFAFAYEWIPVQLKSMKEMRRISDPDLKGWDQQAENIALDDAAFARKEGDRGFPTLFGQGAIAIWTVLESCCFDLFVAFLANEKHLLASKELGKTKITLGRLLSLDDIDRVRHLAREIDPDSEFKKGLDRFEHAFKIIKLSGLSLGGITQAAEELQMVRNLLVHKAGIVDVKFVESCGWMNRKVGELLTVNKDLYTRYLGAAWKYLIVLRQRLKIRFGGNPVIASERVLEEWSEFDTILPTYFEWGKRVKDLIRPQSD